jgi:hypothetical protein
MGQFFDRCDIIDMLEESVTTGRAVAVEVRGGERFSDRVRDVVTAQGQDFVEFREHGRFVVNDILDCARAEPFEHTYDGKG